MSTSPPPESATGSPQRASRFATVAAGLAAAALFALLQAGLLLLRQQEFDVAVAIGLAKAGVIAALVTVAGLWLMALALRRWHPVARRGERDRATRSLLFGLAAAVGAWMLVDAWVAGPLVPTGLEIWLEVAAALAAGVAAGRRPPSARFCRRAAWLLVAAILFLFVPVSDPRIAGAPATEAKPAPTAAGAAPAGAPDVVLVSIDTLRADRLGAYGSERGLTPEIDRLAAEGFLYERALASSPWTVPSVASMLTGLPTIRHGAGLPLSSGPTFFRSPLSADAVTLAERFAAAGYRTRAVVANGFLSPGMGMARGFEVFDTPFSRATGTIFVREIPLARLLLALFPVQRWGDYRAEGVTARGLQLLAEDDPRPLFLWLHYIDPHTPFQAEPGELDLEAWSAEIHQTMPEVRDDGTVVGDVFAGTANVRGGSLWLTPTDRARIVEFYDRAVAYVDSEVGRLFQALRAPDRPRPVVAALTSDHGEELWDHGGFEHGHDYYREVTRVPLIFWGPGRVPTGRAEVGPVGLVDVPPTLCDLAGLEVGESEAPDEGRSLAPTWRAVEPQERMRIRFSEGNLYGTPAVLLEDGPWRFILRAHGAAELYHAFDDPGELTNRSAEHPEVVARYRELLEPRLALFLRESGEAMPEMDAETKKALKALGYI